MEQGACEEDRVDFKILSHLGVVLLEGSLEDMLRGPFTLAMILECWFGGLICFLLLCWLAGMC